MFQAEDLDFENYSLEEPKTLPSLPKFLFTNKNSYFEMGKLGRNKINQKMNLLSQVAGQVLAEALRDRKNKIILKKNSLLDKRNLEILANSLKEKKFPSISIPHSTN